MAKTKYRKVGEPEKPLETKRTKKIRIAICILYVLVLSYSALPFIQIESGENVQLFTILNLIFDGFRLGGVGTALYGIFLLLVPVVGFLFESFDKSRAFKCLTGVLCPIIGIAMICFGPGLAISIGALFSLLTYLIIFVMSVYLFLVIREQNIAEADKKEEAKPKHDFKIEK